MSKPVSTPIAEPVRPPEPAKPENTDPPKKVEAEKAPEPSAEAVEAKAREVTAKMFAPPNFGQEKPEPKPKPEKKEDKPEPEKPKPEAETKPTKPEKKQELPPPISEAVKPDSLKPPPPPPKPEKEEVSDGLTDEDHETLAALDRMQKEGKAPADIVDRTKKFWDAEAKYIEKWEREHRGETFNVNDDAHSEFYEQNEPTYDQTEYNRAVKANMKDAIKSEVSDEVKSEQSRAQFEKDFKAHEAKVAETVGGAVREMIAEAGFREFMEHDGKLALTKEIEAAMYEAAPAAKAILIEEAEELNLQVAEIERIVAFPDQYHLDMSKKAKTKRGAVILPHQMINDYAVQLETNMAALPPEETMREGKRFVTNAEFADQVNKIVTSKATEETKRQAFDSLAARYYTIGWEDVKVALVVKHGQSAKARIEALGGIKRKNTGTPPPKSEEKPKVEIPLTPPSPPRSPSVSTSSDNVDTTKRPAPDSTKSEEQVARKMWA